MRFRKAARQLAIQLFRSENGQRFLDRIGSHVDLWRGYGAGAYVDTSGETVLFELVRKRNRGLGKLIIFDVGANIGDFSAAAFAALGGRARIHAFEPARQTFEQLAKRFGGNNAVILNNVALGRETGERPLFGIEGDSGKTSFFQRHIGDNEIWKFQEAAKVVGLSEYCMSQNIERIDLLKMDVEGSELEVLAGAGSLFDARKIAICSFEFGGCNLDSRTFLRDFFEFFQAHDMDIFRITPAGTILRLPIYGEQLEKFTTTNYVAMCRP